MTPGQAAYEALHASIARRQPGHLWVAWYAVSEINDGIPGEPLREDLEAAAQAAIGRAADELAKLREQLAALAAKWDANADRNQRNGQSLLDQGDEYGSEGLAVAEALGACHAELTALLQTPGTQPGQQETNQEGTK